MKRRRVKLGLYGLTVAEIIPYCQNIIAKMDGNPNFVTPSPALVAVEAAVTDLDKAYKAALDGGKSLKATLRVKREAVFNIMRPLRDYVNQVGDGDEEVLNSSGFPLAELPSSIDLNTPGNVRTRTLQGTGGVGVRCDRVKGATGYQVRYRLKQNEVELPWTFQDPMGPSSQEVTGLESAKYHEFQMRATGSGKPSPWSGSVDGLPA